MRNGAAVLLAGIVLTCALTGCGEGAASPGGVTVAAAASMAEALAELEPALREAAGAPVTFVFGSSGLLKEQVLAGAPYDLFLSADMRFPEEVVAAGESADGVVYSYAAGRIAVIVREGLRLPDNLNDLLAQEYATVTIANPTLAPYGLAAREALSSVGAWEQLEPRVIYGENIRQSVEYVRGGNVDAGIVALALVVTGDRPYWLVPAEMHQPLLQGAVITAARGHGEAARRVLEIILGDEGDEGAEVLARHGFERVD